MERRLEDISFEAPDMKQGRIEINAAYVRSARRFGRGWDLSKFIL